MKKLVVIVILLVVAVVVVISRSGQQKSAETTTPVAENSSHQTHQRIETQEYAAKGRIPAYYDTPPAKLPPTLSPELFTGNQKLAYQVAKEIPETLAQLPCYCHCDRSHGHKSLHSCFESEHGESCGICIGEALMAYDLQKRSGLGASEIRQRIITAYGQPMTD